MSKPYFPIFADISDWNIVVIGGGKIAERRIRTLLSFAEHISVVAPDVTEEIRALAAKGRISHNCRCYEEMDIEHAHMVLAATDDSLCNEQVAADCRKRGILVNTAHQKEQCGFYFPGVIKQGPLVIGVTASGKNHAQVKSIREDIEKLCKEKYTGEIYDQKSSDRQQGEQAGHNTDGKSN